MNYYKDLMKKTDGPLFIVVDDDADLREGVVEILKMDGKNAVALDSVMEAYGLLEKTRKENGLSAIGAVICDVSMPNMSGTELLDNLREGPLRSIPFILISGVITTEQVTTLAVHDPDIVLLKPFTKEVLLKKIEEAIKIRTRKEMRNIKSLLG